MRRSTRDALLAAAQEMIAAGQQDSANLAFAECAGVSVGSFYNHFGSREALIEAAVDLTIEQIDHYLSDRVAVIDDPVERAVARARLYGRLPDTHPLLAQVIVRTSAELTSRREGFTLQGLASARVSPSADPTELRIAAMAASGALERLLAVRLADPAVGPNAVDRMTVLIALMLGLDRATAEELASRPLPTAG